MTDRLSLLIKVKNLSAAQFADEIGVQRSSISHLMSGRNKPSLDMIQKTLQRFPEVSSEWLLFGKGEMVKELNLFDSQTRSAVTPENGIFPADNRPGMQNQDTEPTLFTAETQNIESNQEVPVYDAAADSLNLSKENIARPVPNLAETERIAGIKKESTTDSDQVISKKSGKKESAIDQIIVFYEDRTFIAYTPGN